MPELRYRFNDTAQPQALQYGASFVAQFGDVERGAWPSIATDGRREEPDSNQKQIIETVDAGVVIGARMS
jgi:hypothetical protein